MMQRCEEQYRVAVEVNPQSNRRIWKIGLITGPCPPGTCGVGDYTRVLASALEQRGVKSEVVESGGGAHGWMRALRSLKTFQPDLLHLQYPTAGFGKSLVPQVFSLCNRTVLTVHEFEGAHLLRRLAFYPLWLRSRHVIFTTESNRKDALKWAPWLKPRNSVIPLGANIGAAKAQDKISRSEIVHFGLIRPDKGIEKVLEFSRMASAQGLPISVRVLGSPQVGDGNYLRSIRSAAAGLPITWELNLPAREVAQRLGQAAIAYQPYPDGASEKRASLLAALANGVAVITTRGRHTPSALEGAVCFCSGPAEALTAARKLLHDTALRKELSAKGLRYAQKFSWDEIAEAHIRIYQQLLSNHANRY